MSFLHSLTLFCSEKRLLNEVGRPVFTYSKAGTDEELKISWVKC